MKKQTTKRQQLLLLTTISIIFILSAFTATFAQEKSIAERQSEGE